MTYGVLGALLGLTLGAAGGMARRSPGAAITAALIGLVLGAAAGTGTTFLLLSLYHALHADPSPDNATQELYLALATHGGIWVAIGAAAGLGLGLGLGGGRVGRTIIGGVLGAAIATAIYEFGAAMAFPLEKTLEPTAMAPGPRFLAHLTVALCVSAGRSGPPTTLACAARLPECTPEPCRHSSAIARQLVSSWRIAPDTEPERETPWPTRGAVDLTIF